MSVETWRDRCSHSPECLSSIDCAARDAAPSSTQVATEQPNMPKKPKPPPPVPDHNCVDDDDDDEVARHITLSMKRDAERHAAQLALATAQRFHFFAASVASLKTLGGFPAIELITNAALNELTVLSRELHDARIAKVQS